MGSNLLTTHPFPFHDPAAKELQEILMRQYDTQRPTMALVQGAEPEMVPYVNWDQPMYLVWHQILREGSNFQALEAIFEAILADRRAAGIKPRLEELLKDSEPAMSSQLPDDVDGVKWVDPVDGAYERLLHNASTLLDFSFLQRGLEVGAAVARLRCYFGHTNMLGTGFRIGPDLLLTNHHVAYHEGQAADRIEVAFRYETPFGSSRLDPIELSALPVTGNDSLRRDWAVLRVSAGESIPSSIPILSLTGAPAAEEGMRVSIVQHPNGEPKKLGMHANLVTFVDDDVVQYMTDTMAGSSGSPVFDPEWRLVALHHRWVAVETTDSMTGEKRREHRNEGIRIDRVHEEIVKAGLLSE